MANECPSSLWAEFLAKLNAKGKNFDDLRKNLPWRVLCRQLGYTDKHEIDLLEARCVAKKNARPTRPLSEGFPRLASQLSTSPPSVPDASKHKPVSVSEDKDFGLLSPEAFGDVRHIHTRVWGTADDSDVVPYASENDVAALVRTIVSDIANAIGVEIKVYSEIAAFGVRPDLWVMFSNNLPIGVIEVKKPDLKTSKTDVLDEPTVLGEIYDFMMQLPNFYGTYPIFGMLTTMEKWRFCWFPGEHTDYADVDTYAAKQEEHLSLLSTPKKSTSGITMFTSPTKSNPRVHRVNRATMKEKESSSITEDKPDDRCMRVSRIFHQSEGEDVTMRAIASCVLKMVQVTHRPIGSPFENLKTRMLLRFTKNGMNSVHWSRLGSLEGKGKWDEVARPEKYLYAIEDLGSGAYGRVWLTCTSSGAICVLKFPKTTGTTDDPPGTLVQLEVDNWNQVYPEFEVSGEIWSGRAAIRMPHFAYVPDKDRLSFLPRVRQALLRFRGLDLVHEDVTWSNIGQYRASEGEVVAVVYDLGRLRRQIKEDEVWVDEAIHNLESTL